MRNLKDTLKSFIQISFQSISFKFIPGRKIVELFVDEENRNFANILAITILYLVGCTCVFI